MTIILDKSTLTGGRPIMNPNCTGQMNSTYKEWRVVKRMQGDSDELRDGYL